LRAEHSEPIPIDLQTALEIASGRNPDVVFARARIPEAEAQEARALTLWLPSIRAGLNYNKHDGRIQDAPGNVFDTSRNSFYTGLGANAQPAASPTIPGLAMNFHLADALLQPHIAEHAVAARNQAARTITNDTLLQTALAYNELLRAAQERAVALDTLERAEQLAELTGQYARTGQGLESDDDRARTELALRRNERQRADEGLAVASARLAQFLRLDPSRTLLPQEAVITPIDLVPCDRPLPDLVAEGLQRRPELAENRQLVAEAVARLRREQFAPLVPSVLVGMSYGTYGGGLANNLIHYGDRLDADAIAYWEVRNLGFGECAARREAQSRIDQARQRSLATMDRVAREVVEAATQVESRRRQIDTARDAVETALSSYDKNLDRIRNAQGLPIEVLQSLQALNAARREYLRAIADFNAAQFQLHRALGCPNRLG
jgi:outer membrane protein TolC